MKLRMRHTTQNGLTMVEFLIAMMLGVFLTGGLIQLFADSRKTYQVQEGLSRVQENGRFALDFIARDIRMAGYRGCPSQPDKDDSFNINLNIATPSNYLYVYKVFIEGFEAISTTAWTPTIGADDMNENAVNTLNNPIGGSDVLSIRRAGDQGFSVDSVDHGANNVVLDNTLSTKAPNLTLTNDNLTASTANFKAVDFLSSAGVNKCALAVIADCSRADVFQISSIAGANLNYASGAGGCVPGNTATITLAYYVAGGAQVFPMTTTSYYVRNNAASQPSLYRRVGTNASEELVEGVERMEILYGVDTADIDSGAGNHGVVQYYVKANAVTDWAKVVSVRIRLLVRSDDNVARVAAPSTFNGFDIPADRRIRRVFSATIALRNRLS